MRIYSENTLLFNTRIFPRHYGSAINYIRELVEFRGFDQIMIDFSLTETVFQDAILPLLSVIIKYREEGVYFSVREPKSDRMRKIMQKSGWLHHIDPQTYPQTSVDDMGNIPVINFRTPNQQGKVVNLLINPDHAPAA
jgi:hypothetical protein